MCHELIAALRADRAVAFHAGVRAARCLQGQKIAHRDTSTQLRTAFGDLGECTRAVFAPFISSLVGIDQRTIVKHHDYLVLGHSEAA